MATAKRCFVIEAHEIREKDYNKKMNESEYKAVSKRRGFMDDSGCIEDITSCQMFATEKEARKAIQGFYGEKKGSLFIAANPKIVTFVREG